VCDYKWLDQTLQRMMQADKISAKGRPGENNMKDIKKSLRRMHRSGHTGDIKIS